MFAEKINNKIWEVSDKYDKKRIEKETFVHEDVIVKKDIQYSNHGQRSLLDMYVPKNHNGQLPIIINVPGGGYTVGEKENNRLQSEMFARQGFCVLTINYRRINEESFPAPVKDLFDVFAFIKKQTKISFLDADNIFLMGDSAGAHIVALASAMAGNQLMQYDFGVFDDIKISACAFFSSSFKIFNTLMFNSKYKKVIYGNKINFHKVTRVKDIIDSKFPPNIVISPIKDFLIFQTLSFNKKCKKMGVESKFIFLKKGKNLSHNSMVKYPTDSAY